MTYVMTDNTVKLQTRMKTNVPIALRLMLNAIRDESRPKTPMLTGELRSKIDITVVGNRGWIRWKAPYAEYQERGYTSGPVRRYTTPGTGKHFAVNAVRSVSRKAGRYFRRARI